ECMRTGEFFLMRSMTLLKNKELDCKAILGAIETLNELSYIYIELENPMRSLQYSKKAFEIYHTYTKGQDDFPAPVNIITVIDIKTNLNPIYLLNKKYMGTLKSLFILRNKIKPELIDMDQIATYMCELLQKQLKYIPALIDNVSWATEAIKLAEYFLSRNRFNKCKMYLNIACIMIRAYFSLYFSVLIQTMSVGEQKLIYMNLKSTIFSILMYWVRYGLVLLYTSRERFIEAKREDNLCETNNSISKSATMSVKQLTESLMSPNIDCKNKIEEIIYIDEDNYITNYNDAKRIFVRILELLNYLKADKSISGEATVRVEIAQCVSRAYKYLAFYEFDKIKQMKLQKRRIEVLENCLKTLQADDNVIRSFVCFEIGVVNSIVLNIIIENLRNLNEDLNAKELLEIEQLVKKSVMYFQLYTDNHK
ncbi:Protein KBP-like protein, partial [Harpegnathos saltator]